MTIPIEIELTDAHWRQLEELSRLVLRREMDILPAVLRDPDLAVYASGALTQLLDKHIVEQRKKHGGPRPIDFKGVAP